jgi:hypothetical protein
MYRTFYYPDFCMNIYFISYCHYSLCHYYNSYLKGKIQTRIHYYKESLRSFNFTVITLLFFICIYSVLTHSPSLLQLSFVVVGRSPSTNCVSVPFNSPSYRYTSWVQQHACILSSYIVLFSLPCRVLIIGGLCHVFLLIRFLLFAPSYVYTFCYILHQMTK